ncbi:MAG: hypothetical protein BWY04_01382 [candidate division CPR1 bacterium ADurb.Bin160]|uniref:Uncharacterized protein n=1 Tax=candidate division CPR1 bacterium ADurb.Bin160 TaxID=1852826 RepID=A0A1V5ZJE8_9BACT|nr:MAG: hypothetical protein BWY04_01382 [candidate division CPR1 bacterium ADurb.Bin160]
MNDLYNEDLIRIFNEELFDGFIKPYEDSDVGYVHRITSKAEFKKLINKNGSSEVRGVVTETDLFLLSKNSWDVVHYDLLKFLAKSNSLLKIDSDTESYDKYIDNFLTVQVNNKKIYIGESYENIEKLIRLKKIDKYINVLKRLKIPFEIKKIWSY